MITPQRRPTWNHPKVVGVTNAARGWERARLVPASLLGFKITEGSFPPRIGSSSVLIDRFRLFRCVKQKTAAWTKLMCESSQLKEVEV